MHSVLWLGELTRQHSALVGAKALHLARIRRAGMPVPDGFCIPTTAHDEFVRSNGLQVHINALQSAGETERRALALQLQHMIQNGVLNEPWRTEIRRAYLRLGETEEGAPCPVAVRSSASTEDLPGASFAGQQLTVLNVLGEEALKQAIRQCWASLWSPQAVQYRDARATLVSPGMAVLVQRMVDAEAAGVAFSADPVSGRQQVVIEAAFGLGESVVNGQGDVDRYFTSRETCLETAPPVVACKRRMRRMTAHGVLTVEVPAELRQVRVLTPLQVQHIARAVLRLEELFATPQDVEWAWSRGKLSILQSRPITASGSSFFTDLGHAEDSIWTSGFLNERFPAPVSPLGWSLIRELLEELAFRDPLRYLGAKNVEKMAITRLYQGHPYVNMFVFQTLYRVFPDWLLPEDAQRFFPRGQVDLRLQASYPRSVLDPRFLCSMLRNFLRQPALWSPWHNFRVWASFAIEHGSRSRELEAAYGTVLEEGAPVADAWAVIEAAQRLNCRLLAIHRWSLTWADLSYSLLRRLLIDSAGPERGTELAAGLVCGLPNRSMEVNEALQALAQVKDGQAFPGLFLDFLSRYGHRSLSLDILQPTFGDEPQQVLELMASCSTVVRPAAARPVAEVARKRALALWDGSALGWPKKALFAHALRLVQRYMPLREEQRFLWQRTLALQRKLFLLVAQRMVAAGVLANAQDVFLLTKEELQAWVQEPAVGPDLATRIETRVRQFRRLCQLHDSDPALSYPPFLKGDRPLEQVWPPQQSQWHGQPVSPGTGEGRVCVLHSPRGLADARVGDVLVTHSADPAWTPVFGKLSALVLEHGGQLSHAAVVAREYGLPTVTGIPGITQALRDGDLVTVNGSTGDVARLADPQGPGAECSTTARLSAIIRPQESAH